MGIIVFDKNFNLIYLNEYIEEMFCQNFLEQLNNNENSFDNNYNKVSNNLYKLNNSVIFDENMIIEDNAKLIRNAQFIGFIKKNLFKDVHWKIDNNMEGIETLRNDSKVEDIFKILLKYSLNNVNIEEVGTKTSIKGEKNIVHRCFLKMNEDDGTIEILFKRDYNVLEKIFQQKCLNLSKIAHDFKTPLLSIAELVDQISENISMECNISDQIKDLCEYVLLMIKDLDLLNKKEMGKEIDVQFQEIKIRDIVHFCSKIFQTDPKVINGEINFLIDIDENVPLFVKTDPIRLKQVLINLLSNSFKFTNNGFVKLSIIKASNSKDLIKISVEDSGKGIDNLDEIFNPYNNLVSKQNNEHGAGLGMSIIRDLIEKIGSDFNIDSTLNTGTSISFNLKAILNEEDILFNSKSVSKKSSFNSFKQFRRPIPSRHKTSSPNKFSKFFNDQLKLSTLHNEKRSFDEILHLNISSKRHSSEVESVITHIISNNVFYIDPTEKELIEMNAYDTECDLHLDIITEKQVKIMIVDDVPLLRKGLIRQIKFAFPNDSIEFIECSDGLECLYELWKAKVNGKTIDVVITDQSMTYMDGTTLAEIVHRINCDHIGFRPLELYMCTGFDNVELRFSAKEITYFDKILTKPITNNVLKQYLNKCFS